MSRIFLLAFGAGSVYSLRKESKKPLGWGLPTAFMGTVSVLNTFRVIGNKEGIVHPHDIKQIPKIFIGSVIGTGTIFCLGHLFTKMAYPVFSYEN